LGRGNTLVLHPGPDGRPVVSAAMTSRSVILDSNLDIALNKRAQGKPLQPGEKAALERLDQLSQTDRRVADETIRERASKNEIPSEPGIAVTVDRTSTEYQTVLTALEAAKVGKTKGVADRNIVADAFFAVTETGVKPTFATADGGVYKNLLRMTKLPKNDPAKVDIFKEYPNGFDVTIGSRTLRVIPLPPAPKP